MKKKNLTILITSSIILGALLCGCGEGSGDAVAAQSAEVTETVQEEASSQSAGAGALEDASETVREPETEPVEEKSGASKDDPGMPEDTTDYEAVYDPVLSEVLEVVDNGYDYEKEYTYISDGLMEKTMYPGDKDLHDSVGYLMKDLSGDGIPELLIGSDENWGDTGDHSYIYSIFSIKDDKPFPVVEGWARSSYSRLGEDHFYYCGSGGAAITIFGESHLSRDGCELIWDHFYFTDEKKDGGIGMYHNTSGVFDAKAAEELHIPDDEFYDKMDAYEKKVTLVPWTPIGKYKNGGSDSGQTAYDAAPGADEHEIGFDGTIFTIDGRDIDVKNAVVMTDRIMDAKKTGDWVILDCHVNPHFGLYEFYNINSGDFEYDIQGANLTWRGDDLSTAVYSMYTQVYDVWGHLIGWVDEGEISGLEWIDDETVEATCRVIDDAGREKEFTKKIEYSPEDKAVFSYYEYLAGGKRDTKKLTDSAPAGAVALLMVNPPDRILDKLPAAQIYDKNAYDRAVVVSLEDGEKIRIDPNDTYVPGHDKIDTVNEQDTGDAVVYQITVPEGAPNSTLVVSTPGKEDAGWDVATLSGKSAVISRYLIAGE